MAKISQAQTPDGTSGNHRQLLYLKLSSPRHISLRILFIYNFFIITRNCFE